MGDVRTPPFEHALDGVMVQVAANNSILTDAVSRLRLLDRLELSLPTNPKQYLCVRSETAWRYAEYSLVWEGLRQEFELDQRCVPTHIPHWQVLHAQSEGSG